MTSVRICFVGDSLTAGTGDEEARGWPSLLCADEIQRHGHDITLYNLGVRAETSELIAERWERECTPRLPEHIDGRLVFMFGLNDMADQEGVGQRLSHERSADVARAMMSRARSWKPTLWLGPTPPRREPPVVRPSAEISYTFYRERVQAISERYAAIATELEIPYLDLFAPLAEDDAFNASLEAGDGVHPTAEGFPRIARLIAAWEAWRGWLG
jgi:lysophospholipase L1-like esterase